MYAQDGSNQEDAAAASAAATPAPASPTASDGDTALTPTKEPKGACQLHATLAKWVDWPGP